MNSNDVLVSIITVVFNGSKTLEQTIQSVINQSYSNIEYILIDGGSTDGTLDIIRKYESSISFWISEKDNGLYDAMNKGIGYASGKIVGMINSDDWYEANAVELVVDAYTQNPDKKIFHGDRYDVMGDGSKRIRKFHSSKIKFLYYGMTYNHPSMFVMRDMYQKYRYNTNLRVLSDYQLVLSFYMEYPDQFYYIETSYVNYRIDGISSKMSITTSLKEGFISRKIAGMSLLGNIFAFVIRMFKLLIVKI